MNSHLVVISVDALVFEDVADLAELPNIAQFFRCGSVVKSVTTVYPSLTHTVHASMITGNPPAVTNVPSNTHFLAPGADTIWYNKLEELGCPSLFHLTKDQGLTSSACRWPLTAEGFEHIDYLIPEVSREEVAKTDMETLLKRVSTPLLWEPVIKGNLPLLRGKEQPYEDQFSITCACEILKRYKPNLLITHPCLVDTARHHHGLFNVEVTKAVQRADSFIGELLSSASEAGILDNTNFVVTSDHGHLPVDRDIALNVIFVRHGLIRLGKDGRVTSWKARSHACGLSAHIYLYDRADAALKAEVASLLSSLIQNPDSGISDFFTLGEVQDLYQLSGDFSFVVETDGHSQFNDSYSGPVVRPLLVDDHHGSSSHGHLPYKGVQPLLLGMGPGFKQGVVLEQTSILNEGPTFAALLGLAFPNAQGRVLQELLI